MKNKSKNKIGISFFLPIRKNSKRIKNKNIRPIQGYKFGLTELKIDQLKKFKNIANKYIKIDAEYVISTDCNKILKFAKKYKWLKVFKRNKSLATDDSLDRLIKYVPEICQKKYILWTHVTSPLFNEKDYIQFLISFFRKQKNNSSSKSAFSADEIQKFVIDSKGKWISHNFKRKKWPRTQDVKKLFVVNSAAFISERNTYIKENDRLCKKPFSIKSRIGSGFDIDTLEDFKIFKNEYFVK